MPQPIVPPQPTPQHEQQWVTEQPARRPADTPSQPHDLIAQRDEALRNAANNQRSQGHYNHAPKLER